MTVRAFARAVPRSRLSLTRGCGWAAALHGIGPGSPVLFMMYSSVQGGSGCLSEDVHRSIFLAAVRTYVGPFPVTVDQCTLRHNRFSEVLFEAHPSSDISIVDTQFAENSFEGGWVNGRKTLLVNQELVGGAWTSL